jgi:glycosyltransferase involved in cell wall biosynthesis
MHTSISHLVRELFAIGSQTGFIVEHTIALYVFQQPLVRVGSPEDSRRSGRRHFATVLTRRSSDRQRKRNEWMLGDPFNCQVCSRRSICPAPPYAMKGIDDFLRVLALLPHRFYGLVVGVGPDESSLKALASELGIRDRVVFASLLATPLKCYHSADLFLITSHYEPFGLVVLEASACGIPVAGFSARGGLMQLLSQVDAVIVDQRNCRALADAVLDLATPESGTHTSRRAYIEAEYSWDKTAALLAQSYSLTLSQLP